MKPAREGPGGGLVFALLQALALYLVFEDFLLRWLPVSEMVYSLARFASEAALYGLFGFVALARATRGLPLAKSPIDRPLAAFVLLALASIVTSQASFLGGLINFRTLVRYVAAFYLVVWLAPSGREVRRFLVLLVGVGALQGAVALLQNLQGGPTAFWLPRASELEIAGYRKEFTVLTGGVEQGAAIGTLGHSVALGLFALAAGLLTAALALAGRLRAGWLLLPLFFVAALASYSRAALLAFVVGGVALLVLLRRERSAGAVLRASVLAVPLLLVGLFVAGSVEGPGGFVDAKRTRIDPVENLQRLASGQALEESRWARSWVLLDVGREIVASVPPLGFGPDETHAKLAILQSARVPLQRLVAYKAFEDVYWVALLAYYGFAGVALFAWVLWRLFAAARRVLRASDPDERALAGAFAALVLVTVPLTFVVRTFEFRAFAFGFWMLAGLVAAADERLRRDNPARAA